MKQLRYLLPLMFFAICLNSCKKSSTDTGTQTPTTKTKYLIQMNTVIIGPASFGSPVSTSNISYTYDNKKRLSTAKNLYIVDTYSYNSDGTLFSITNTEGAGTKVGYTEFTYDGSKLQSYKYQEYANNVVTKEITYTYVYSGDKATEMHFGAYYEMFTYDSNGNVIKVFNHDVTDYSNVYTYDNKKSGFSNSPFKYPIIGNIDGVSPNNRLTRTTVGLSPNVLETTIYVYDSDGYPTSGIRTSNVENDNIYKYTYIYSTLD